MIIKKTTTITITEELGAVGVPGMEAEPKTEPGPDEEHGCWDCRYAELPESCEPCKVCSHCYTDKWKPDGSGAAKK